MTDGRRAVFRCHALEEIEVAIVRSGGREQQVRLVDQSAEGFAIASNSIRVQVGDSLKLRTSRGWSESEVVRCDSDGEQPIYGLKLLGDLPDPRDKVGNSLALFRFRSQRVGGYSTKAGPLLTISAVAILGFWLYMAYSVFQIQR